MKTWKDFAPAPRYRGGLTDCLQRLPAAERTPEFERRWYRAQMRDWAGHVRLARVEAAMLGKPVEDVRRTNLHLACIYRDATTKRAA